MTLNTAALDQQPLVLSALVVVGAYLLGSLPFAVLVSRAMGLADPRTYGSGNPGATNVLRSGNKAAALSTLVLDALKGYVPVLLTLVFGPRHGLGEGTVALVGLAAFLGHLWPVFFRFQGGKGVATAAGILFAFDPWLGLATAVTWIVIAAFFRYSSLAAIAAAVFAPFYRLLLWGGGPIAGVIVVMSLLLVWRHRGNISKLIAGTESRIGARGKGGAGAGAVAAAAADARTEPEAGARSGQGRVAGTGVSTPVGRSAAAVTGGAADCPAGATPEEAAAPAGTKPTPGTSAGTAAGTARTGTRTGRGAPAELRAGQADHSSAAVAASGSGGAGADSKRQRSDGRDGRGSPRSRRGRPHRSTDR